MKWKTILATTALVGAVGAGTFYRGEIKSFLTEKSSTHLATPGATNDLQGIVQQVYQQTKPSTPEQFIRDWNNLKEGAIVFAYQHSDEIVAGKYDDRLNDLKQRLGDLFGNLELQGKAQMQQLYGQVGGKVNQALLDLRKEICQAEVQHLAVDIEGVLDKYLTAETRQRQRYTQMLQAVERLGPEDLTALAQKVQPRLSDVAQEQLLKQQGLDVWVQRLQKAYGVHIVVKPSGGN